MTRLVKDIWQEHGCDGCMIDFDLWGSEILAVGESVYCSGCGGHHAAGKHPGPTQTLVTYSDGTMEARPLPRDAAEKAAWLAEPRTP